MTTQSGRPERKIRLPVTIVTGFLGSGKTTLLNYILACQHDLKIGVIVNEIGEIGIDGALIVAASDNMVELSNGCICCSINDDLAAAVSRVFGREQKFDYLIVESTGLADPLPVVLTFLRPEFRDRVRVDSIVTVADADSFSLDLFASKAAHNQLRYADTILLNKCDLATADFLGFIEERIRTVQEGARIVRTTHCRVPLPLVLSVGLFQSDRYFIRDGAQADHMHLDCNRAHLADDGFDTMSFTSEPPFAADRFQGFLEQLPPDIFRAKGVLWIVDDDKRYVFHLVGQRFTLDEMPPTRPINNALVLIGRNLDHTRLRHQLEACVAN